jgi:hypothetical protein
MSRKKAAPVVIIRKDKRIRHKLAHAIAFAATGGASGIVTAAEAASHAQYNARTRRLQAATEQAGQAPPGTLTQRLDDRAQLAQAENDVARAWIAANLPDVTLAGTERGAKIRRIMRRRYPGGWAQFSRDHLAGTP